MKPSFLASNLKITTPPNTLDELKIFASVQFGTVNSGTDISIHALTNIAVCSTGLKTNIQDGRCDLTIPCIPEAERFQYGYVMSPPNSISLHAKFIARTYFYTREEGGRSQELYLFYDGYPSYEVILSIHNQTFLIRPIPILNDENAVSISIEPGSTVDLQIDLGGRHVPLEQGYKFHLQEGNKIVALGTVTKLL